MLVSFVVRLLEEARVAGRVVGELCDIETGDRTPIRSADELVAALLAGGVVRAPVAAADDIANGDDHQDAG